MDKSVTCGDPSVPIVTVTVVLHSCERMMIPNRLTKMSTTSLCKGRQRGYFESKMILIGNSNHAALSVVFCSWDVYTTRLRVRREY